MSWPRNNRMGQWLKRWLLEAPYCFCKQRTQLWCLINSNLYMYSCSYYSVGDFVTCKRCNISRGCYRFLYSMTRSISSFFPFVHLFFHCAEKRKQDVWVIIIVMESNEVMVRDKSTSWVMFVYKFGVDSKGCRHWLMGIHKMLLENEHRCIFKSHRWYTSTETLQLLLYFGY